MDSTFKRPLPIVGFLVSAVVGAFLAMGIVYLSLAIMDYRAEQRADHCTHGGIPILDRVEAAGIGRTFPAYCFD